MKRRLALGLVATGLVVAVPMIAFGGGALGPVTVHEASAHGSYETSSDNWQYLGGASVIAGDGGLVRVKLSGEAYALDYGKGGVFKGDKYAAMKVKLAADGGPNIGSPITFADNRGVVGSARPKPLVNTAEWGTNMGGYYTLEVWVKSANKFDVSGFKHYHLSVIYGQTP